MKMRLLHAGLLACALLTALPLAAQTFRERLQDILLGVFLGAVNGYLIFGSLWSFMVSADYPFEHVILSPIGTQFEEATNRLLSILPPSWLGTSPAIYFAVAIAFVFVLVVFI